MNITGITGASLFFSTPSWSLAYTGFYAVADREYVGRFDAVRTFF